jgi:endonuclease YncB( thermonuclease family)
MDMEYEARVEQVTSGDDLYLSVSIGFDGLYKRVRVRLDGVDTPDAYMKPADSDSLAAQIRKEVTDKLQDKKVRIRVLAIRNNSWSVILHYPDNDTEINLNDELVARGYIYEGRKK